MPSGLPARIKGLDSDHISGSLEDLIIDRYPRIYERGGQAVSGVRTWDHKPEGARVQAGIFLIDWALLRHHANKIALFHHQLSTSRRGCPLRQELTRGIWNEGSECDQAYETIQHLHTNYPSTVTPREHGERLVFWLVSYDNVVNHDARI